MCMRDYFLLIRGNNLFWNRKGLFPSTNYIYIFVLSTCDSYYIMRIMDTGCPQTKLF